MVKANQDFKDLFRILKEENVEYVILGAHKELKIINNEKLDHYDQKLTKISTGSL